MLGEKKKKKNEGKGNRSGKNACCSEPKHNQVFVKNKTESEDVDMLGEFSLTSPPTAQVHGYQQLYLVVLYCTILNSLC